MKPRALAVALAWLVGFAAARASTPALDFYAPVSASTPAAARAIHDLAERMLPVYQESDAGRYLASLSALQMASGNYAAASATRGTLRERRRSAADIDARAVILDLYARARALQSEQRMPFSQAVRQAFKETVAVLGDHAAFAVAGLAATPPTAAQSILQEALDRQRARDNIVAADAVDLIADYVVFDAYRSLEPHIGPLVRGDEERRYEKADAIIAAPGNVRLRAWVVRPRGNAHPLPSLLEFTIYRAKNAALESASRGYAGVTAYTRGLGEKSGLAPYQHDGEDAKRVIEWIASQSWSDGRVAMMGGGYSGFTAWAAAKLAPRALKGIATLAADAPGINVPMNGNVFQNSAYRWSLYVANTDDERAATFYDDERWRALDQKWYTRGSRYRDFGRTYGVPNPIFIRWLNHPSYDRFWQKMTPFRREFARIDIPVLAVTGYFAGSEPAAIHYFNEHLRYRPRADHSLVIGPFDDGVMRRGVLPVLRGVTVDPIAHVDLEELRYAWFDHLLMDKPQAAEIKDRVNYQITGANAWGHAASIDAMATRKRRFYFGTAARGTVLPLADKKPARASFVSLSVDLADRRNSAWTQPTDLINRSLAAPNGLLFASAPMTADTEFSGPFSLKLDLRVNKMDVDLYAMLFEQLSSGEYVHLFDPAIEMRASYARDRIHRRLLQAGVRQSLTIHSDRIISRRFRAGSRLVMILGVNKRPDREVNYGTGEDVSEESVADANAPLKIRWYSGSYLEMPIGWTISHIP